MAIALYARKSVERENSISCETQLEYCRAMIKPDERNTTVLEFVDNGYSGGNTNRDGFKRMMRKIEEREVTKVLVYRLDRISRSLSDFVGILNTFKKYGVEFVSTQEAFDTSSPYGELIVKILAVFAEFERQSIIARVTQAYEHRSEMGLYMGGRRPYGYELESGVINNIKTKKLKTVPEEAQRVRYIFDTYAIEGISLGKLLEYLKDNAIYEVGRSNWTTSKLSTILKNPVYVMADWRIYEYFQKSGVQIVSAPERFDGIHGVQLYGRNKQSGKACKAVVMTHTGIIPPDIWLKCQYKLQKNKQMGNAVSNKTSWLGGKMKCGICKKTMTTVKGKKANGHIRRYFVCTGKTHYKICEGTTCSIYVDSVEALIFNEISKKLTAFSGTTAERRTQDKGFNELKNKLKAIGLTEEHLAESLLNGNLNGEMVEILNAKAKQLKQERMKIQNKIIEFNTKMENENVCTNFAGKWCKSDYEQKREVCCALIDSIIVDKDGNLEIYWKV